MITLAPSIAAVVLAAIAFAAFLVHHREDRRVRDRAFDVDDRKARLLEEQATAETHARAIRTEVLEALETLNAKVKRLESEVFDGDEAA